MQELLTGRTRLPGFSGEWSKQAIGEIANVIMGQSPSGKSYNARGIGIPLIQGNADIRDRRTIDRVWTTEPTKHVRAGEIVLTVRAPVGYTAIATEEACLGRGVCGISAGKSTPFLFHALVAAEPTWALLEQGSTFTSVNSVQVRAFELDWPQDVNEGAAISTVLDDADAEIDALGRLIAKKRDIKRGMMQELLTGRTRLPGFRGEWVKDTLGAVSRIKTGSRNNQDKDSSGSYPFFVRSETVERISTYSYDTEAILVPGEGGIGSIFHYINGKFEVHQRVYKISDFSPVVAGKFIYYYMRQFFGSHAIENSVKATVDSLRLPTFTSFELTLPPSRAEQHAIAAVLLDADAEIEALERRLEAARAIKQGMMQELLTGRTRLPIAEEVSA